MTLWRCWSLTAYGQRQRNWRKEANEAVQEELQRQQSEADWPKLPRKRKAYTVFSSEQRAAIGKYAAENGNAAAIKKFKGDFDRKLGESTVHLFKQKYHQELLKAKERTP